MSKPISKDAPFGDLSQKNYPPETSKLLSWNAVSFIKTLPPTHLLFPSFLIISLFIGAGIYANFSYISESINVSGTLESEVSPANVRTLSIRMEIPNEEAFKIKIGQSVFFKIQGQPNIGIIQGEVKSKVAPGIYLASIQTTESLASFLGENPGEYLGNKLEVRIVIEKIKVTSKIRRLLFSKNL